MSESKTEPVWSIEPPEWINFFSNDMFLDYKEFVSKKVRKLSLLKTINFKKIIPKYLYFRFRLLFCWILFVFIVDIMIKNTNLPLNFCYS